MNPTSVHPTSPKRIPTWSDITARSAKNVWRYCDRAAKKGCAVTNAFSIHYNTERPNQALSCGNRPPRVAFPDLPKPPPLPAEVDPDLWLAQMDGRAFARRILPNGTVEVDRRSYYLKQTLAGQQIVLVVHAPERVFEVLLGRERLKVLPIKGVVGQPLSFEEYAARMREEARSEYRRWLQHQRRWRQASRLRELRDGRPKQGRSGCERESKGFQPGRR